MSATIYAPLQHSKVLPPNVDTETHIIFQPGTPDRSLLRFRRRHCAVVQPEPHTTNNEYQVDDEAKDVASKPMQSESEVQVPSLLALAQNNERCIPYPCDRSTHEVDEEEAYEHRFCGGLGCGHREVLLLKRCSSASQTKPFKAVLWAIKTKSFQPHRLNSRYRPPTTGMATSAAAAVLSTTELVEAILQHLPFEGLLKAQQVSWYFNNVVQSSKQLQRKLFLEPGPTEEVLENLAERNGQLSFDLERTTRSEWPAFTVAALNPVFECNIPPSAIPADNDLDSQPLSNLLLRLDLPRFMRMLESGKNCWQMLASQPPCFVVDIGFTLRLSCRKNPGPRAVVHDNNGRIVTFEPREQRKEIDGSWTEVYDADMVRVEDTRGVRLVQIALALYNAIARRQADRGGVAVSVCDGNSLKAYAHGVVANDSTWVTRARARLEESTNTA
ncbi:hypothetical protein LTR37_018679 [Vermiconidia calcicola]|uniref:Uncharacterized protein n=1 Tax=Vermiconidia calcicola TaxID=1690605 RepID=A0ACC3MHZ5_9PEZI|nr:hypothetical protein LTR37_018679 [Vermiconidia calcicola]